MVIIVAIIGALWANIAVGWKIGVGCGGGCILILLIGYYIKKRCFDRERVPR